MAWPKGKPRPEGAGRKPGKLNRKTEALQDICDRIGLNPFEAMADIARDQCNDTTLRLAALKELCQYLYPKRKAIEFSGSIDVTRPLKDATDEELDELIYEEQP